MLSKKLKKYISSVLMVIAVLILSTVLNFFGIGEDTKDSIEPTGSEIGTESTASETEALYLDPEGVYTSKDDVALYIYLYGELPDNFMTKTEARKLGWESGSLEKYAPGCAIGGDRFGNYEGRLPKGKSYIECDIGTVGKSSRGACRIVYATDFSAIYYTDDHYESFTLLYGGKE